MMAASFTQGTMSAPHSLPKTKKRTQALAGCALLLAAAGLALFSCDIGSTSASTGSMPPRGKRLLSASAVRGADGSSASTTTSREGSRELARSSRPRPRKLIVFYCGGEGHPGGIARSVFPEAEIEVTNQPTRLDKENVETASPDDILVVEKYGGKGCPEHFDFDSYLYDFPGITLHFNSEPFDVPCMEQFDGVNPYPACEKTYNRVPPGDRVFVLGPRASPHPRAMKLTYLARQAWQRREYKDLAGPRPRNTGKHFLLYAATHYIHFREEAARNISQTIAPIHYAGKCQGSPLPAEPSSFYVACTGTNPRAVPAPKMSEYEHAGMVGNKVLFHDYRFGLVLENSLLEGYITEKILFAFLAGTVPVYYGTKEIFDIFNKDAFIYYDIHDPQPALDRIRYLEEHPEAYDLVLQQPILANGEKTIEDYFSFDDAVGGGKLKQKIREMVGWSVGRSEQSSMDDGQVVGS